MFEHPPTTAHMFQDALAHHQAGRLESAEALYRRILEIDGRHVGSLHLLGVIARHRGRHDQAEALIGAAICLDPANPAALSDLGAIRHQQGKQAEAIAAYLRTLVICPEYGNVLNNLGLLLLERGQLGPAQTCYRQALTLRPDFAEAWSNLGLVHQDWGKPEQAIVCYDRALTVNPGDQNARSNRLMALHYAAATTNADLLATARQLFSVLVSAPDFPNDRDPHRRLRIGYVSGDLGNHPVGYFLGNVLTAHNRTAFDLFVYSNRRTDDAMTTRLFQSRDRWRRIADLSDDEAERAIRADRIDILVDLSGHTARNRLPLLARRVAPVQATWLGYFGTTGLAAIDYILADGVVVPTDEERFFVERVWRLAGCYLCYAPHQLDIALSPPPAIGNGFVTFGCFNNRAKLTVETLALWARILAEVPDSRLFLKTRALTDGAVRQEIAAFFEKRGIMPTRLMFEGFSPLSEALAAYGRMDIALDPFPFGGGATTAETLWMGVPLVTLKGGRWTGRMSADILAAAGINDLTAIDADSYVAIARRLAGDLPGLAERRSTQRTLFETSRFCDGRHFAVTLEEAFRGMWRRWCGQVNV